MEGEVTLSSQNKFLVNTSYLIHLVGLGVTETSLE